MSMPFRPGHMQGYKANSRQGSRKGSIDPRNDINVSMNHYIGIDVGTGSARACIINELGDIVGLAAENIGLWQPQTGYYVRKSTYRTRCRLTITGTIHERHLAVYLRLSKASSNTEQY